MKLFTQQQYETLLKNGHPDNRDKDHVPVVKLFLPGTNFKWILTEIDPEEPTIAFGLCDLAMGFPELGYVSLDEITSVTTPLYTKVERDLHFNPIYPISVYAEAARIHSAIVENNSMLKIYSRETPTPT